MSRKIKVCVDCGTEIGTYTKSIRCRDCFYKSLRNEYAVCPLCGEEKHRTEYKEMKGKRRQDSRALAEGCKSCRDARNSNLKTTNKCKVCKQDKPKEGFSRSICAGCIELRRQKKLEKYNEEKRIKEEKELAKKEKAADAQKRLELFNQGLKRCAMCEETKSLDSFSNQKNNRIDGKQAYCLSCMVIRRAKWAQDNPDRNIELRKLNFERVRGTAEYRTKHKYYKAVRERRMKETPKDIRLTGKQWEMLCAQYKNTCLCCGATKELTIDHIVPVSKGGLHTLDNVQPLCMACNLLKTDTEINYKVTLFEFE